MKKNDKTKWSMLNWGALDEMAEVLTKGSLGHGGDTAWRDVDDAETKYFDAMMRHINQYKQGITVDDGASVLAKVMVNAMILYDLQSRKGSISFTVDNRDYEPGWWNLWIQGTEAMGADDDNG